MAAPWNEWSELLTETTEFWRAKMKPMLNIDIDYSDTWEMNSWEPNRTIHNRKLDKYCEIYDQTQSLLVDKLEEYTAIPQKLTHLVAFISIFEPFARLTASDLTDGSDDEPNYNYQTKQFQQLINNRTITKQERKFIFEQMNAVVPTQFFCPEEAIYFGDCRYDPSEIGSFAGYLISRTDATTLQQLVNKVNDFILLNNDYLIELFFNAEKDVLQSYVDSIPKLVAFLEQINFETNFFNDIFNIKLIMKQFQMFENSENTWMESFVCWIFKYFEQNNNTQSNTQFISALLTFHQDKNDYNYINYNNSLQNKDVVKLVTSKIIIKMVSELEDIITIYNEMDVNILQQLVSMLLKYNAMNQLKHIMYIISSELNTEQLIVFINFKGKINWTEHIELHDNLKLICSRILGYQCDDSSFDIVILNNLCTFTSLEFVGKILEECMQQTQKEHLKCVFLTKCYKLSSLPVFKLYLDVVPILRNHGTEFQIISEALKCIRNTTDRVNGDFEEHVINMFVKCIGLSYSDPYIKRLINESSTPKQIAEHFFNSLSAVSLLKKIINLNIVKESNELKQFCVAILKQCQTFWGDRNLTASQNQSINKELKKIKLHLV